VLSSLVPNTNVLSNVTKSAELCRRPSAGCTLYGVPDVLECLEPTVGGRLVADTPPDALLHIERGLVSGQVAQAKPRVSAQELAHRLTLMPAGAVDVEGDAVMLQTAIEMAEDFQEALAIAMLGADDAAATQQWGDPAREVKSGTVLAGGRYPQALAVAGPVSAIAILEPLRDRHIGASR
jgi:hypothetical protein